MAGACDILFALLLGFKRIKFLVNLQKFPLLGLRGSYLVEGYLLFKARKPPLNPLRDFKKQIVELPSAHGGSGRFVGLSKKSLWLLEVSRLKASGGIGFGVGVVRVVRVWGLRFWFFFWGGDLEGVKFSSLSPRKGIGGHPPPPYWEGGLTVNSHRSV